MWHWAGWIGLLILLAVLGGCIDRFLVRAFHWPVPPRSVWVQFLNRPSWAAVTALLMSPALEELGFRAFLCAAPKLVFTGLTFFPAYAYMLIESTLITMTAPTSPAAVLTRFLHSFWVILPAGAINLVIYRYRRDAVVAFFRHRAGWIFWMSCVLFGAGHSLLYSNSVAWWAFALVLPQFLAGVGLAYVRASFGLRWSVAAHYAMDVLVVLPSWLYLSAAPSNPLYVMFLILMAFLLALILYGLVVLWRVARFRW